MFPAETIWDVRVNMPGEFSVYNALAALAVGKVLGLPDAGHP